MVNTPLPPSGVTAWRRRQRRLRAHRRFILWSTKMEVAAALHHAARQRTSLTDDATTQPEPPAASCAAAFAPAPVIGYVAPAPAGEGSSRWKRHLAKPEYVAPTSDVTDTAPTPVIEYVAPPPYVLSATPATVIEDVTPTPAVICATTVPVIEHVEPAPVIEHIAPAPPMTISTPSQQFPPAYTTAVVTLVSTMTPPIW